MGELTIKDKVDPTIEKKPDVTITLEVDASELWNLTYPPEFKEIYEHCTLFDSRMKRPIHGPKLPYFETEVLPGEWLEWVGKAKSEQSEFTIKIDSIVYAYGKESDIDKPKRRNFFDRMALCSRNGNEVIRKVEEHIPTGLELTNAYWINFWIYKGKEYRGYSIDPRLKIQ